MRFCRIILSFLLLASLVGLTTGCPRSKNAGKKPSVVKTNHPERGPHGAPLAYWNEVYLLEVRIDRAAKEATVYVLKGTNNQPQPIEIPSIAMQLTNVEPPLEIQLLPAPGEDDPKGSSSCFRATNPAFAAEEAFYGIVSGKVGENVYEGEFDERARSPVLLPKKHKK